MGCDIHFYVEKWSDGTYDGPSSLLENRDNKITDIVGGEKSFRWVSADKWTKELDGSWDVDYDDKYYKGRNYYLFSILADVRNYEDKNMAIQPPRGVPKDVSDGVSYILKRWEGDYHTPSFYGLHELLNVDWSKYEEEWLEEFKGTIEKMKLVDSNPLNVRCVFFFDN
jgi:hypothetical protein